MLQYFKKNCPFPSLSGTLSDIDRYDLQPFRSDYKLFMKEAMEIIVKV